MQSGEFRDIKGSRVCGVKGPACVRAHASFETGQQAVGAVCHVHGIMIVGSMPS